MASWEAMNDSTDKAIEKIIMIGSLSGSRPLRGNQRHCLLDISK